MQENGANKCQDFDNIIKQVVSEAQRNARSKNVYNLQGYYTDQRLSM